MNGAKIITEEELREMKGVDIRHVNSANLTDLKDVKIKKELSVPERVLDFISQVGNPYCFKIGDTIVKLNFQKDGPSCQEAFYGMVNAVR